MTELLHWALEHSDPERIAELMEKYKEKNLTIKDVYGQDVLDAMFADEANIMTNLIDTISSASNASVPDEDLRDALGSLRDLVDQIDNAGNLHRMGGLAPLVDLALGRVRPADVRTSALWTLGVAVQNNPPVQQDLVGLDGLSRLGGSLLQCGGGEQPMSSDDAQFCAKLLYVFSGLIKNNSTLQAAADGLGVSGWLLDTGLTHRNMAIAKKTMSLLETVLAQSPESPILERLPDRRAAVASALLELIRGREGADDVDAAEKALRLVHRILMLRPLVFASSFPRELATASAAAVERCKRVASTDDELCVEIADLAKQADAILSAPDVSDAEL